MTFTENESVVSVILAAAMSAKYWSFDISKLQMQWENYHADVYHIIHIHVFYSIQW